MAMHTAITAQQIASHVQLRCAGHRIAMALPAGRLYVPCRQSRLLPGLRAAVSLLNGGRGSLPEVTHHAADLLEHWWDYRMSAEALGKVGIGQARFFQSGVAGSAAVYDSELRNPYLLDAVVERSEERRVG